MVSGIYLGLCLLLGLFAKGGGGYIYIRVPVVKPCIYPDIHSSMMGLVHSSGTVRLPPGHIFNEYASTRGTPAVESGNSITLDPLARTIFLVPSWVQMTPTKFVTSKLRWPIPCRHKRSMIESASSASLHTIL